MKKILVIILLIFVNQVNGQNKFSQIQQKKIINEFISFVSKKDLKPTLKDYTYFLGNDFELEIDEIDKTCTKNCKKLFAGVKKYNYQQKSFLIDRLWKNNLFGKSPNNAENLKISYLKTFHNTDIFEVKKENKTLCYLIVPNESENNKVVITEIVNIGYKSYLNNNDVSFYFKASGQ